ncbi:MAG: hypothetical protein HC892_00240 [Saprospiraceae bacterium]|nr:hypothetical protein [Saprospiraceae bacterium]
MARKSKGLAPTQQTFNLVSFETDDGDVPTITFRQATQGDKRRIAQLTADQRQVFKAEDDDGEIVIEKSVNMEALRSERIWTTFVSSNLTDDDGNSWFDTTSKAAFMRCLDVLSPEEFDEVYDCCTSVNPEWDFSGKKS